MMVILNPERARRCESPVRRKDSAVSSEKSLCSPKRTPAAKAPSSPGMRDARHPSNQVRRVQSGVRMGKNSVLIGDISAGKYITAKIPSRAKKSKYENSSLSNGRSRTPRTLTSSPKARWFRRGILRRIFPFSVVRTQFSKRVRRSGKSRSVP